MPSPDKNAHLEEIRTMLRRLKGLLARSHSKQVQLLPLSMLPNGLLVSTSKPQGQHSEEHGLDEESLAGLDKLDEELTRSDTKGRTQDLPMSRREGRQPRA